MSVKQEVENHAIFYVCTVAIGSFCAGVGAPILIHQIAGRISVSFERAKLLEDFEGEKKNFIAKISSLEAKNSELESTNSKLKSKNSELESNKSGNNMSLQKEPQKDNTPNTSNRSNISESHSRLPLFKAIGSSENTNRTKAQEAIGKTRSWITRPGENKGAWIDLYLNRPCVVKELASFFSFPKYGAHSQVRNATVIFDDGSAQKIMFEYLPGLQRIALEPRRTEKLRIVVDDVFPAGSRSDVEIAQIELFGTNCE